jgi:D-cysteine desulfhydrase
LLADISAGRYAAGDNVLFIMTGGSPGLYAYASDFLGADCTTSTAFLRFESYQAA